MKKKILLSSIVTIALCLCMIAGSTFALFTDTSETMNVTVGSGNVDITANLSGLKLYSIVDADANTPNAEMLDVFGSDYYFVEEDLGDVTTFLNGGTAELTDTSLTLTNITPGDKVSFDIKGKNNSNVNTNVRCVISLGTRDPEVLELADMLYITVTSKIDNVTTNGYFDANGVYTSDWLFVPQNTGSSPANIEDYFTVTIRFLPEANSDYANLDYEFNIVLQAVQANEEAPSNNGTVNP